MTESHEEMERPLALVLFSRQFAALIETGVSLMRSLRILGENAPAPYAQAAVEMMPPVLEGNTLSGVMARRPDLFSPFYTRMVRAGEVGGVLEVTLGCMADLLEEGWQLARRHGRSRDLAWLLDPTGAPSFEDWAQLDVVQRDFALMLFCRAHGTMLSAGVWPPLSLETAADLLPTAQRDAVRAIARESEENVAARLAALGFLPSLVTELMDLGEQHGVLDQTLEKASMIYRHALRCRLM